MRWILFYTGIFFVLNPTSVHTEEQELTDVVTDRYELQAPCAKLLRKQVNLEMHASLVYTNMAAHFNRNSIARGGFSRYFKENAEEEREHAQKIINFLNIRGNHFEHFDIKMPTKITWSTGLEAIQDAIILEKEVNNKLYHIHDVAESKCKDANLMDFLEREFLEEQVESIDRLLRHATVLGAISKNPLAEYLYDRQLAHDDEKLEL